jgi:DNA gyrase subunit B
LVLTLLWRYARRLVESGRVFSAVPPLYRVAVKGEKEFHYTFTEDEQATLVAKLAKARKEIKETQRFKGLGEMDADQMALVLEAGRTVRQLTVDDAAEAEHMFDLLMGADVASRREFIVANALSIDPKRIDV